MPYKERSKHCTESKIKKKTIKADVEVDDEAVVKIDDEVDDKAVVKIDDEVDDVTVVKQSILDRLITLSEASRNDILSELVTIIYDNTHCVGGKVKNVLYKELPNIWSSRKDESFSNEEKEYECKGKMYDDCTVSDRINNPTKETVKLIWDFNNKNIEGTINKNIKGTTISLKFNKRKITILNKPNVVEFLETLPIMREDVFMYGNVQISGDSWCSGDHRGSDHCLISLPINRVVQLTNPSLDQFIEAF